MDFNKIISYYERLESTKKRLEMIDILAQLFSECVKEENRGDFRKIIYLTQGRLVSEIDDFPTFGIAEKMVIQAISKFTGIANSNVKNLVNKKGDVGEALESILTKREGKKQTYSLDTFVKEKKTEKILEISRLYSELEKISKIKGDGSQDQKINLLTGIFRLSSPQSAKFIVKIILSDLRMGIADKTILDSLALSITGSKDKVIREINPSFSELDSVSEFSLGVLLIKSSCSGITTSPKNSLDSLISSIGGSFL